MESGGGIDMSMSTSMPAGSYDAGRGMGEMFDEQGEGAWYRMGAHELPIEL